MDRTCKRCEKRFEAPYLLRRHQSRKTPCDPIVDPPAGGVHHACKYCGRTFASATSAHRHMRHSCKIANSEEGMEKLFDHTLQRQNRELQ